MSRIWMPTVHMYSSNLCSILHCKRGVNRNYLQNVKHLESNSMTIANIIKRQYLGGIQ